MKLFILLIITTWSFGVSGSGVNFGPDKKIVSSPEDAAIEIYYLEKAKSGPEPDQHKYKLYQIDFKQKTVKEVVIPELTFSLNQTLRSAG